MDLTKAFDLVSRDGLFKVLTKIDRPPKLQSMIDSFHTDTKGTVQFNDSTSEPFEIRSGIKEINFFIYLVVDNIPINVYNVLLENVEGYVGLS